LAAISRVIVPVLIGKESPDSKEQHTGEQPALFRLVETQTGADEKVPQKITISIYREKGENVR